MRQIWPLGHWALLYWQRQRPDVSGGLNSQVEVSATDSQESPSAQGVLQPPQCCVSLEISTQAPPQQRLAEVMPQLVPFGNASNAHPSASQRPTSQGLLVGQISPETH